MKLDRIAIRNSLSIRYNPIGKSEIPLVTSKNFQKNFIDSDGRNTEKLLKKSIKSSLKNFDSVSLSLSGGIDSSLSLGLIRKVFPNKKIHAVCGVFEETFNESVAAKQIAKKFDANFHIIKMDSMYTNMPEIISITGKPKWNTYNHLVAKTARKYSKMLVTGDGGDELFGGYTFRYHKFLNLLTKKDTWKDKVVNYLECHNRDWVPDQNRLFHKTMKFNWDNIFEYFRPYFKNKLKPLQQVMLADFNGKLIFDFIPTGIAIKNYYNLNSFSPLLDVNVRKFALGLSLPQKYNVSSNKGKLTLRKITKRLGINHLETKRGFSPSLFFDWKKTGKIICEKYLIPTDSAIYKNKLINNDWVLSAFEKIENDGNIRYLNRLTAILALEIWYRIFISKEMNPKKKL